MTTADRLAAALRDLLLFGSHEGACDNKRSCQTCHRPIEGCHRHGKAFAARHAAAQRALDEYDADKKKGAPSRGARRS